MAPPGPPSPAPATPAPAGTAAPGANQREAARTVRIGRISGAHGLKGALRFSPDDPDSTALSRIHRVTLELRGESREYEIASASRSGPTSMRITLSGVNDAAAAEALKGAIVTLSRDDLPPPAAGEFYYFDAIGCDVFTTDGRRIGAIEDVFPTGANDVWVVRDGPREVLVPVIADVVKEMNFAARRVTIEPVPGLLD
ncbi:MAG TPA: ribosome maturation factor RimM [Candidatus Binataceae bacterium]|nr:ribosome maturation factor RimM [Candidatus Binataceae bacterium]